MQLLDLFNAFKVQKNLKKYIKKTWIRVPYIDFCLKIFLLHKCRFNTLITFCITGWRFFGIHVNILYITVSNKTNLTSAVPQFNSSITLHFILLVGVNIFQIIPVIYIVKLSKMMNVAVRGHLFVVDREG